MRPVTRGEAPDATTWEAMSPVLRARIGRYCSYCEFPVRHTPHVEHIVPKERFPAWRDRWDNLAVACAHCNSRKGSARPAPEHVDEHVWPTRDNTARAFDYEHVFPRVSSTLPSALQAMAARTRGLFRLAEPDDPRASERAEVYLLAQRYASRLPTAPDPALLRDAIVDLALARGFFSVWMHHFEGDGELRRRLVAAFPGTARDCYDEASMAPVPRPGGRL